MSTQTSSREPGSTEQIVRVPRSWQRQRGFTIVELLVVWLIVAITITIALPGLQQIRSQSRENVCKNHLKFIGLSLHNYNDVYGCFPPGWTAHHPKSGANFRFGWQTSILPFLDHSPLYNQISKHMNVPSEAPEKLLQTAIQVYRCPADRTAAVNAMRGNLGTSNYSANHGDQPLPRWLPGRMSALWPGQPDTPTRSNGIMFWNSRVRMRDIPDGISNTICVGERGTTSAAGVWAGVGANNFENDQVTECSDQSRINQSLTGFSSMHGDSTHFMLCDGSVRAISATIDSKATAPGGIYQHLSNRQDRQAIPNF